MRAHLTTDGPAEGLPSTVTLPDGRVHHDPKRLDDATLAQCDPVCLPLHDDPQNPPAGQVVSGSTLERDGAVVRRRWEYREIDADQAAIDTATSTREARAEAVVAPTADLLHTITRLLSEERARPDPDLRWVVTLEALRQLGLKGVADEATHGRASYARIYNDLVT